jgi:predicted RNase H-like HicB family nuclease
MTITYQKANDGEGNYASINKKVDGNFVMSIPMVADNTDYQEYLEWVAQGNTIEEAD